MVYGLTKGQASPTSQIGMKTAIQVDGVFESPLNPIALAVSMDASFVARAFSGDKDKTKEIIKQAVLHKGFALVDILQPCITFNKLNTFKWFKDHSYYIEESYNPLDRGLAFKRAIETEKIPLGIIYINPGKSTFEDNLRLYKDNKDPLYKRNTDKNKIFNFK